MFRRTNQMGCESVSLHQALRWVVFKLGANSIHPVPLYVGSIKQYVGEKCG